MAAKKRTKRARGRPTKLSEATVRKIETTLMLGTVSIEDACSEAGISPRTLRRWRKAAREGEDFYADFFDQLEMVCGAARVSALKRIAKGKMINGKGDWKAEAWCAERAHPQLSRSTMSQKVIDQAVMDRLEEMEAHMSGEGIAEMYAAYAKVYGLDAD